MKVGIMADTHDNLPLVKKAIERFNQENVEIVLHAGDYIAPFTVACFKGLQSKLIGIFGNNDGDQEILKRKFSDLEKAEIRGRFAEIMANDLKIGLLHGENTELLRSLVNTESYSIIVHGHSHEAEIQKKGNTIIINPGEVCGYLSGKSTIALLDTETSEVKLIQL